ncbi:MAG: GNAT family N-acetyltransferase [Bacteroides sp.]|nr:GNAT family N-acetyltransferase [Bacteroides sp.]
MKILQKDGYRLRAPEPEDLEVMYLFENTPTLWEVSNATGPYSRFFLKQYIEQHQNDLYTDRQLRLMIENSERKIVGIIDLYNFEPFHSRAEVGVVIAEDYRRRGIARLALQLLKDYCLDYLGIHQLYAYMDVTNEASIRLFAGCGFKECAYLKDWMRTGTQYRDVKMMQLQ